MGALYLGRRISASGDRSSDGRSADVVLKHLPPEHADDPKHIEMFIREAQLSARFDHANIVRTLDLVNAGDDYYIVMEYVRGGDLRTILRRAKRRQHKLSIDSALFVASEVLGALHYAHGRRTADGRPLGVVHRDVSPSNILLSVEGAVKLTDFGIAKSPTQGSVMFKLKGKLGYMSPEQARGEPVDVRADLFAVGVVLYETLVGERLFVGQIAQAAAVYSQAVRAPSKKRGDVPAEIDEIVLRALSLDPAGRYSSAQEFRTALVRAAERARRKLSESALAADLRHACGEDSANWLSLDVPAQATLDGGAADGTGVIFTNEDEFEGDRPLTGTRPGILPSKELTSVVALVDAGRGVGLDSEFDADGDLPATHVARDPFAMRATTPRAHKPAPKPAELADSDRLAFTRTDFAMPLPGAALSARAAAPAPKATTKPFGPGTDYDTEEDSAVRTRIQTADALSRRPASPAAAAQSRAPAAQSKPPAAQSKPSASAATAARAHFEPPVPRPSVAPPSGLIELPPARGAGASSGQDATRVRKGSDPPAPASPAPGTPALTRITRLPPEPAPVPSATSVLPTRQTLSTLGSVPRNAIEGHDDTGVVAGTGSEDNLGRGFEPGRTEATRRPRSPGPASLSALERNLGGRPFARGALGVLLILVLIALGIGLGVLLSGPSGIPPIEGAPEGTGAPVTR